MPATMTPMGESDAWDRVQRVAYARNVRAKLAPTDPTFVEIDDLCTADDLRALADAMDGGKGTT